MSDSPRPTKRTKVIHQPTDQLVKTNSTTKAGNQKKNNWRPTNGKYKSKSNISASGINHGDIGIFISCDKGQEKRCLTEMDDLLSQYIDPDLGISDDQLESKSSVKKKDIESEILAELDSLKPKQSTSDRSNDTARTTTKLITLDIPCVVFIKLPQGNDPIKLVYSICQSAADHPNRPRSRHIKRLTPVSLVTKVLNNGIESLCDVILPSHFVIDSSDEAGKGQRVWKYAIRPNIRNNNQISRDEVIETVAKKIESLGQGKHGVDLKGYEKLILVEVYRNICGMSVLDGGSEVIERRFKRFNLSEIYSSGRDEG